MPESDPLMTQALRDSAASFNNLLQIILIEVDLLSRNGCVEQDAKERLRRISDAARKAAILSRSIFGSAE